MSARTGDSGLRLDVLVDYGNIPIGDRRKGLLYLADRFLDVLPPSLLQRTTRVRLRLYHGWYEEQSLTHTAQGIAHEIQSDFPRVWKPGSNGPLHLSAELAYSLECDPGRHLFRTYRPKNPLWNMHCHTPPFSGCAAPTQCRINAFHAFLTSESCPESKCPVRPADVLYRAEQKLVDTMLAADALHIGTLNKGPLVFVSADDDVWPIIRLLDSIGAQVFHILPVPGRQTPSTYTHGVSGQYTAISL